MQRFIWIYCQAPKGVMKKFNVLFVAILLIISCNKESHDEIKGTVRDLTGRLDGCGKVIELDNGTRLEPVQLPTDIVLNAGERVAIKYDTVSAVSICMAGVTVKITSLRYL
jgi:hypothetical protein